MSLTVIGAGFGRTGTESMKRALEELGLGPCHHMKEVIARPKQVAFWRAAMKGERADWDTASRISARRSTGPRHSSGGS